MLYVVDQDREKIYPLTESFHTFSPAFNFINDYAHSVNLMYAYIKETDNDTYETETVFLGTFNNLEELDQEIRKIKEFTGEPGDAYFVSGYFDAQSKLSTEEYL